MDLRPSLFIGMTRLSATPHLLTYLWRSSYKVPRVPLLLPLPLWLEEHTDPSASSVPESSSPFP